MAKHIKRFSTYDEYIDYVTDSSFEPPLVSVCDETTFIEGKTTANFMLDETIKILNPNSYMGVIYVTDEHEVLYTYNIGPVLKASNNSHILGERQATYEGIPYHKDLYYCWKLHSFGGTDYTTVSTWEYTTDGSYEMEGEIKINNNEFIESTDFWRNYCASKSINVGTNPYNVTGYPGNYIYPTLSMNAGENKFTDNYPSSIQEGDEVQVPILRGVKLLPGTTLIVYTPEPS